MEFISFLEVLEDVTSEAACRAEQNKGTRNKIFWTKLRVGHFHWVLLFYWRLFNCYLELVGSWIRKGPGGGHVLLNLCANIYC